MTEEEAREYDKKIKQQQALLAWADAVTNALEHLNDYISIQGFDPLVKEAKRKLNEIKEKM